MRLTLSFLTSLMGHAGLGVGLWVWNLDAAPARTVYAVQRGEVIAVKFLSSSTPTNASELKAEKRVEHALPQLDKVAVTRQSLERPIETSPVGTAPSGSTSVVKAEIERAEQQDPKELPEENIAKRQEVVPRLKQPAPEGPEQQTVSTLLQSAVVAGADVDELPRKLLTNVPPSYPADALREGVAGRVRLFVRVRADGRVADVHIYHSSGSTSLDNAAVAAVRNWRFEPARRGGRNVAAEVVVPVRFWIERG